MKYFCSGENLYLEIAPLLSQFLSPLVARALSDISGLPVQKNTPLIFKVKPHRRKLRRYTRDGF
jgi:hypothetical protein